MRNAHRKKIHETSEIWRQREVGVNKKKDKKKERKSTLSMKILIA